MIFPFPRAKMTIRHNAMTRLKKAIVPMPFFFFLRLLAINRPPQSHSFIFFYRLSFIYFTSTNVVWKDPLCYTENNFKIENFYSSKGRFYVVQRSIKK